MNAHMKAALYVGHTWRYYHVAWSVRDHTDMRNSTCPYQRGGVKGRRDSRAFHTLWSSRAPRRRQPRCRVGWTWRPHNNVEHLNVSSKRNCVSRFIIVTTAWSWNSFSMGVLVLLCIRRLLLKYNTLVSHFILFIAIILIFGC